MTYQVSLISTYPHKVFDHCLENLMIERDTLASMIGNLCLKASSVKYIGEDAMAFYEPFTDASGESRSIRHELCFSVRA